MAGYNLLHHFRARQGVWGRRSGRQVVWGRRAGRQVVWGRRSARQVVWGRRFGRQGVWGRRAGPPGGVGDRRRTPGGVGDARRPQGGVGEARRGVGELAAARMPMSHEDKRAKVCALCINENGDKAVRRMREKEEREIKVMIPGYQSSDPKLPSGLCKTCLFDLKLKRQGKEVEITLPSDYRKVQPEVTGGTACTCKMCHLGLAVSKIP